jgi:hypothetical protein
VSSWTAYRALAKSGDAEQWRQDEAMSIGHAFALRQASTVIDALAWPSIR